MTEINDLLLSHATLSHKLEVEKSPLEQKPLLEVTASSSNFKDE